MGGWCFWDFGFSKMKMVKIGCDLSYKNYFFDIKQVKKGLETKKFELALTSKKLENWSKSYKFIKIIKHGFCSILGFSRVFWGFGVFGVLGFQK